MSKFQVAILIIFGLFIVGGVVAFSVYKGSSPTITDLSVWGTLPTETWNSWFSSAPIYQNRIYRITYTYVPEKNFDSELVNAIAEGRGPDIIFAFHDRIIKNQGKITPIPYSSFSLRDFQNTFIDGANVLTTPQGELGLPILVDPLVLYYNKDIFANFSLVNPPQLWEQMYTLSPTMTVRDTKTGNIIQSTIPLGAFSNVLHAKEILSAMIMQAGGAVISDQQQQTASQLPIRATLSESFGLPYSPGNAALLFFTEFSNPTKIFYTWNRSLPDSLSVFSAGDSAMFVGFASDLGKIKEKNPNLVFDVTFLPQSTGAKRLTTYGRVLAFAVSKSSAKLTPAFGAVYEMMSKQSSQVLADILKLPPARRDALQIKPNDPFQAIFYDSAIQSVAWKDPDTEKTADIFQEMIDSVASGRVRVEEAVFNAQSKLQSIIESTTFAVPSK